MLRLSTHCHILEKGDSICLFHALGISPVYFNKRQLPLFKTLSTGSLPKAEIIKQLALTQDTADENFKALRQKKFIVTSYFDDEKELRQLQHTHTGTPRIGIMYLLLTDSCNLSCAYCYVRNLLPRDHTCAMMSENTAKAAIRFFAGQTAMAKEIDPTIIFYGGEPLLNFNALKAATLETEHMVAAGKLPEQTQLQLVTNGTLLTNETIKFLKLHRVSVVISIDGPLTGHSRARTNGMDSTHKKILIGLQLLAKNKLTLGISCTLHEDNLRDFDKLLDWLTHDSGASSVGFNIVRPIPPFSVRNDYAKRASRALIHGYEFLNRQGIPEDRMGRKVTSFINGTIYPYDCAGCGNQLVVAPDGAIGPCAGFLWSKKYFVTRVESDDFNPASSATYLRWSKRSPLNMPQCHDCPAIAICGGGCPFNAEISKGSLFDLDEIFCIHAKSALHHLIWKLHKNLR